MAEGAVRIALLARAGKARDQLHRALTEGGALIVVEGDPAELDPAQVASLAPTCFLVSLEPAIESALDRFDDLLATPGIDVMFDDAEVTSRLDGWDLNRWARHLATKLLGAEGLPPVPDSARGWLEPDLSPTPGAPPTPAQLMDNARLEDYTVDASDMAGSVPVSRSLHEDELEPVGPDFHAGDLSLNLDQLGVSRSDTATDMQDGAGASGGFDLGIDLDMELGDSVSFSSFSDDHAERSTELDADVAAMAAELDAFERNDQRLNLVEVESATGARPSRPPVSESIESVAVSERPAPVAAVPASSAAPSFDFSNLALAPMGGEEPASLPPITYAPKPASQAAPRVDFQLDPLPDAEPEPAAAGASPGVVLILAGLGGPDAVRQLLSSLPDTLAVPVLLYQHLEVGKHERLVEQLAKISRLPVVLAGEGGQPQIGQISLLPAGMTAVGNGETLQFSQGSLAQLLGSIPAANSMVVVLSGTDSQLVPAILQVRDSGGTVLAQDPEVCFDATAAETMQRAGVAVHPALGLARQIAERWPQ